MRFTGNNGFSRIGALIAVSVTSVLLVPWIPGWFSINDDPSWAIALHQFFVTRPVLGTESVNNFGPLGFLYARMYYPSTFPLLIGFWIIQSMVFSMALWFLLDSEQRPAWVTLSIYLLILDASLLSPENLAYLFIVSAILFRLVRTPEQRGTRRILELVVLALTGILGLTKFSFLILGLIAVAALSLDDLLRLRRFPRGALVFVLCWVGGWSLSGQKLAAVLPYLTTAMELSRGYSVSLGEAGGAGGLALAILSATLAWLALTYFASRRLERWESYLSLLTLVYIAFWFKAGTTRFDWVHIDFYATSLLGLSILLVALFWSQAEVPGRLLLVACLIPPLLLKPIMPGRRLLQFPAQLRAMTAVLMGTHGYDHVFDQVRSDIRRAHPLPPMSGTVDVIPYNQGLAIAQDLEYRPRPLYQSYMVSTPYLNRLNASFWKEQRAPAHVLFDIESWGDWYPSMQDSLSWPELLTRYRVDDDSGGFLTLTRRSSPLSYKLEPSSIENVRLGAWIDVPACDRGLVWVKIGVHRTLSGRLATQLLRAPTLTLSTVGRTDRTSRWNFPLGIGAAGFLLSPTIHDRREYRALADHAWTSIRPEQQVTRLNIAGSRSFYEPAMEASFACLVLDESSAVGREHGE